MSNPNQKRHMKKKGPELTPEQQAAELAALQKAQEEAKKEAKRIELFGKSVTKMSHRQLAGELRRTIRREHAARQPIAGLTILYATVLANVLHNTKTARVFETDVNGNPTRVARLDQINKLGVLHAYPR